MFQFGGRVCGLCGSPQACGSATAPVLPMMPYVIDDAYSSRNSSFQPPSEASSEDGPVGSQRQANSNLQASARRSVDFGSTDREIEYRALANEGFCNSRL